MAALVKTKKNVLIPIDDNHRYDLVVDEDGTFNRIQCKAGRMTRRGEIKFNTSSSNKEGAGGSGTTIQGRLSLLESIAKKTTRFIWFRLKMWGSVRLH